MRYFYAHYDRWNRTVHNDRQDKTVEDCLPLVTFAPRPWVNMNKRERPCYQVPKPYIVQLSSVAREFTAIKHVHFTVSFHINTLESVTHYDY